MEDKSLPTYAVFDDYHYSQRIGVVVRWFVLTAWLFLINYRPDTGTTLFILNGMGVALAVLNGYVTWRIWKGRPITRRYVLALSIMDLSVITAGIGVTTRFENTFFVFYYPALLGLALAFSSRRLSFSVVTLVAVAYAAVSIGLEPGVSYANREEKVLVVRLVSMFGVVAAANLMARIERTRRREAVEAERAQAQRNLETCAELADQDQGPLRERLQMLVPLAKNTLLETRQYIFDLKPLLSGESDLMATAENQVREFRMVAGTPAQLSVEGEPCQMSVAVATGLYRILQEALANVLKHARASAVRVALTFEPDRVSLSVEDDGVGFQTDGAKPGYGLDNMRQRAQELGGGF